MSQACYNIHMRLCSQCNKEKSESNFYIRKRGGLQAICIDCRKELNKLNYLANKEKVLNGKQQRIERNRKVIVEALLSGCVDCGIKDIRVLEFDHLEHKYKGVAQMRDHSLEKVKKEISKCEVVCANCHNIRTGERRKDWRYNYFNGKLL